MSIFAVPTFTDNYVWLIRRDEHVAIVDPGDAKPVQAVLERLHLQPCAIVLTHHHQDHTGGVIALQAASGGQLPVFGPSGESIPSVNRPLSEGDEIELPAIGLRLGVLDVPGHTRGHIAYVGSFDHQSVLFCGDTLFAAGCGRLFEGTAEQMFASLQKLAALPPSTLVYCAHEYTQSNLRFALAVEPDNAELQTRVSDTDALRQAGQPSVPSTMALELATNPFLRTAHAAVQAAVETYQPGAAHSMLATFTALRAWKDHF